MKHSALFVPIIAFLALLIFPATAQESQNEKLAVALADYQKTGEVERCVRVRDIRSTEVIDDQHILFKLRRGKVMLNALPSRCPRLASENRFSYRVTVGSLCSVDTITVLFTTPGFAGPTCGLGEFEVYEKSPDAPTTETSLNLQGNT